MLTRQKYNTKQKKRMETHPNLGLALITWWEDSEDSEENKTK